MRLEQSKNLTDIFPNYFLTFVTESKSVPIFMSTITFQEQEFLSGVDFAILDKSGIIALNEILLVFSLGGLDSFFNKTWKENYKKLPLVLVELIYKDIKKCL